MAQYDLLLTQNVHATLTEYSEKFVNVAKGGLISAIADQTPTVLAGGTDGYVLVRDDAELTGLNWVDISTLGVSVANQANDRIVTATAVTDDLNAEQYLTYNTSQGLLIGSGLGIVFTAAATTYQIYTPASAFTASISIITGTNSAAGAGDITLKAGDGISAGGNVYFQRDTTYGNFYFGTGVVSHLPEAATGTHGVMLASSVGLVSESSDLHWDVASITLTLDSPSANIVVGSSDNTYIGSDRIGWEYTVGHYYRIVRAGVVMRWDYSTTSGYTAFSSPIYIDGSNTYLRLQWDTVIDATKVLYLDGVAGDTRVYDSTGDLTFRDASNTAGVSLSTLVAGAAGGNVTSSTNNEDNIAYFTATSNDIEGSENFQYDGSRLYILTASASDTGQSEGVMVYQYANNVYPGKLNFVKQRATGSTALDNDKIGTITYQFFNDAAAPEIIVGAGISAQVIDASDAVEDVELSFWQYEAGTLTTYTLADLAGGTTGGGWTVSANVISPTTSGDDVRLNVNEVLQFNDATSYISGGAGTGTIYIYAGGSNNMHFASSSTVIYHPIVGQNNQNLGGTGSSEWFTNVYAESFNFKTANEYITGSTGAVDIYVGGSLVFRYVSLTGTHVTYNDILAGGTGLDLGDTAQPFQSVAANRYYVGDSLAYIEETGTGATLDILFVSTLSGSVSLNSLAGAGSSDVSVTNQGNNRVVTSTATTDVLNAEALVTFDGDVFIHGGTTNLGGTTGNSRLFYEGVVETSNSMRHRKWAVRDATGTDWLTARIHDAISVDSSFATPGTDTKCWWERDPQLGTQYWGNATTTYMTLTSTLLSVPAIAVTSTSVVTNLNADRVDSLNASDFLRSNDSDSATGAILFSGSNNVSGGYLRFYDDVALVFGSNSDWDLYYNNTNNDLYFDSVSSTSDINFSTGGTVRFTFNMGTYAGTATDWIATSDVRAKTNIKPFELDMNKFLYLGSKAVRHQWKEGWGLPNAYSIGFIAQDIEKFFPELVTIGGKRPYLRGISYGKMVTVAIKATAQTWVYAKEIDARVVAVTSEVEELKKKVDKLQIELNTLKNG